ncbi:hypothetical protein [Phenylobacterium aquaticum]|uniref:hypothetical protein n=1 Tax=Phenylobacterium aquaticum TaxID=1763816 RepID=UPI0026EE22F0|nr:hypothetical protein [Phenylobacterium aquaticum]
MKTMVVVAAAALALAGCQKPKPAGDLNSELESQILAWRTGIVKTDKACATKAEACTNFDVGCKGAQAITPAEAAKGVTAKVVVAMSWNAFDPKDGDADPVSRTRRFEKTDGVWTGQDVAPVNLSTCS